MVRLVVDASVAAGWLIGDEASPHTDAVLDLVAAGGATVPSLWPFEIGNLLAIAERRGRASADDVLRAWQLLGSLRIAIESPRPLQAWPALTDTAREFGLTAYDAAYLELAVRTRSTLATLDSALERAAARAGVPLLTG